MSSVDPHEQVNIAKLLFVGGLVMSIGQGQRAVARGDVYVEQWNISVAESTLPRWVLRGVGIRLGDRSIKISDDGSKILRSCPRSLTSPA